MYICRKARAHIRTPRYVDNRWINNDTQTGKIFSVLKHRFAPKPHDVKAPRYEVGSGVGVSCRECGEGKIRVRSRRRTEGDGSKVTGVEYGVEWSGVAPV